MLVVMGGVFFLSHQPGNVFCDQPFWSADKVVHMLVYAVLAASVLYALPVRFKDKKGRSAAAIVIAVCFLYGCSDEFHQMFIPERFASYGDIAADVAGAALFCTGWLLLRKNNLHTG